MVQFWQYGGTSKVGNIHRVNLLFLCLAVNSFTLAFRLDQSEMVSANDETNLNNSSNLNVNYDLSAYLPEVQRSEGKVQTCQWPNQGEESAHLPGGANDSKLNKRSTKQTLERRTSDTIRKIDDDVLVQTKNGLVRGFSREAMDKKVDVFLGIPFAKAPIGQLRFKKPVPIDPWQGIYEATTLPNSCQQEPSLVFPGFRGEEMWNPNTQISEDCLYLNIWVPSQIRTKPRMKNATVLIWIYGGGYMAGTSTLEVYDALIFAAANDIIVASMNYRVGSFGFLYLGIDEAPGNMGLYDQALAIKWIKDNIESFGGDADSLTLFGESAGAGSVSVHLLSPVSQHLAKRAILQSGVINAPWSYMTAATSKNIALALISDVGCNASLVDIDPLQVMECMRNIDGKNLSLTQWNSYWGILGFPSAPTIDGVFLPKNPVDMIADGQFSHDIDVLIGTNQDEGTYFILYDFIQYFKKDDPSLLEREKFLEIINTIFKNWSQLEREAIIVQYTDWDHIEDGYLNQKMIGDVVGDYYFTCPSNYFASKFAEHGMNVYYYYFTQRSSTNPWGEWMGVMHADEVEYVFGQPFNTTRNYTKAERELSSRIMEYFATFAKTGKPVADNTVWPIYSRSEPKYFILNGEVHGIGKGPRARACAFWNEFIPRLTARQAEGQCGYNGVPQRAFLASYLFIIQLCYFPLYFISYSL